jgi:hypothetical protein
VGFLGDILGDILRDLASSSKIVAGKKNFSCGNKGTCFEVKVLPSGW